MWLSNTASTAMMLPIAMAVLKSLFGEKETSQELKREKEENQAPVHQNKLQLVPTEMQLLANAEKDLTQEKEVTIEISSDVKKEEEYKTNVWKGFLISIPYSASIGGTATLTGTAPNLILSGQLKSFFPGCDLVNFGSWFVFAFPLMVLFLFLGWLWISFLYGCISLRGCRKKKSEIRADAETRAKAVITEDYQKLGPIKDPKFITGWASLFTPGFVTDAVTGVTIVTILFFFPSKRPTLKWWFDLKGPGRFSSLLQESGLSIWIGGRLDPLENLPPAVAVILITIVIALFTEFASNTATIIIFLPVLAELARTGLLMNLMGVLLLSLAINTWGMSIFQLGTYPAWANIHSENTTTLLVDVQNITLNSL
ncbi:hypothetical protein JD844_018819 [Phrynosoma platyrhinos]|uniref:Solute carrier family 13 member 3 n=1 Tax=Phrynosoma platyrhinos TaxID=52577 RepID=A0ABQ7SPB4_PHRPL|nr:hypothetical protein JD844_018819 [Phrynosoma platyrhinos]